LSLLDRLRERERHDGTWRAEQLGEDGNRIFMTQMERLQHAGEHGVGVGAVPRPIAAADSARDGHRTRCLVGRYILAVDQPLPVAAQSGGSSLGAVARS
jgi:DNA-binding transcriptional LysR family regulator